MNHSLKKTLLTLSVISLTSLSMTACYTPPRSYFEIDSSVQFFSNLKNLCGKTFVGETAYPEDPDHDFASKKLVAHIKSCTNTEIRIPFTVGEDHSRTWIITKTQKGLLLKHDHRHHDGTPDEITMYGGYAGDYKGAEGNALSQNFLADEHTAKLIPAASSNVWTISYDPKNQRLTYNLERHEKPRYEAVLQLK